MRKLYFKYVKVLGWIIYILITEPVRILPIYLAHIFQIASILFIQFPTSVIAPSQKINGSEIWALLHKTVRQQQISLCRCNNLSIVIQISFASDCTDAHFLVIQIYFAPLKSIFTAYVLFVLLLLHNFLIVWRAQLVNVFAQIQRSVPRNSVFGIRSIPYCW